MSDLRHAPPEVQLAVDLIMVLEQHHIAPELALKAIAIVQRDFERKLSERENTLKS